jgi:hypothetical protein
MKSSSQGTARLIRPRNKFTPPHFELASALNLYFGVGCTNFTRHELLAYAKLDRACVESCLLKWEARGYLQILKLIAGAEDAEVVVKQLKRIENPAP